MASYFDDHNCQPLADGETSNHMLQMLRQMLLDTGYATQDNWANLFPNGKPPPASKEFIDNLEKKEPSEKELDLKLQCPVCIGVYEKGDQMCKLPCHHHFHLRCLVPWLNKTSTCPLCRQDLPTDDKQYEEYKTYKKREAQRKAELETLHDSMFS